LILCYNTGMKISWLGRVFILLLAALALVFSPAEAVARTEIERMEIDLLPEYDRPEVLVIYRITFLRAAQLPPQITLRIPRSVEKSFLLQFHNVDGFMDDLNSTVVQEGDWILVSFSTPTPTIQLSYYDPGMRKQAAQRWFEFIWLGDYFVRNLQVRVAQPANSSDMSVEPQPGATTEEVDGIQYYKLPFGVWDEGRVLRVQFSYEKLDDAPSLNLISVKPITPLTDTGAFSGAARPQLLLVLTLMAIGALVVTGGLMGYMLTTRKAAAAQLISADDLRPASEGEGEEDVFCSQCGRRAITGDVFCRVCGARL
jgi:hypothetical protein